jgi:hypothetical protein
MTLTWEAKVLEGRKGRLSNRSVSTAVDFVVVVRILLAGHCEKDSGHYEYIKN